VVELAAGNHGRGGRHAVSHDDVRGEAQVVMTRDHRGMELRRGDGSVIAVDVVGERDASPVLLCHGLAESRLSADWFEQAARDLGLCVIAPDRPGTGGTDLRQLRCIADWIEDAMLVLDALQADAAALLGISAGGAVRSRVRGQDSQPSPQPDTRLAAWPAQLAHSRDGGRGTALSRTRPACPRVRRLVSEPPRRTGAPLAAAIPPPRRGRATRRGHACPPAAWHARILPHQLRGSIPPRQRGSCSGPSGAHPAVGVRPRLHQSACPDPARGCRCDGPAAARPPLRGGDTGRSASDPSWSWSLLDPQRPA